MNVLEVNGVSLSEKALNTLIDLQESDNSELNYYKEVCALLTSTILVNRDAISNDNDSIFKLLEAINDMTIVFDSLKKINIKDRNNDERN